MMELTIKDQTYEFHFGMGFLKEVNRLAITDYGEMKGVKANIGLRFAVSCLVEKNVEILCKVLMIANKGMKPRLTEQDLDYYIDNECEDIEYLFVQVLDFLKISNATKSITVEILDAVQKELERRRKIAEMEMNAI